MPTKLGLYNRALFHLKDTPLADLTEEREARFVLDALYADCLDWMLEQGYWRHAMRSMKIDHDTSVDDQFDGYQFAFTRPSDWVKTFQVSASQALDPRLDDYIEESVLWWANVDPIYVRYVSNDPTSYGLNLALWSARFYEATSFELAYRACGSITGSSESLKESLERQKKIELSMAKQFEALREPGRQLPQGLFNKARFANRWRDYQRA